MATATPTLKFTIGQSDLMIEAGVFARPPAPSEPFAEPHRVKLIAGEIVMMSPIGSRHEEIVDRLNEWSVAVAPHGVARVRLRQSLGRACRSRTSPGAAARLRSPAARSCRPPCS
ncbi:MAG: hypothetical protein ACKO1M_16055 [Planctomycetota bacterium]